MRGIVKKWGNSAAVRIPASVMKATHLDIDDSVDVQELGGNIIIKPVSQKYYDLDELIEGITDRNLHGPVDFGEPEGKEVW